MILKLQGTATIRSDAVNVILCKKTFPETIPATSTLQFFKKPTTVVVNSVLNVFERDKFLRMWQLIVSVESRAIFYRLFSFFFFFVISSHLIAA